MKELEILEQQLRNAVMQFYAVIKLDELIQKHKIIYNTYELFMFATYKSMAIGYLNSISKMLDPPTSGYKNKNSNISIRKFDINNDLSKHSDLTKKIKTIRDKTIAHSDEKTFLTNYKQFFQDNNITDNEIEDLLKKIAEILKQKRVKQKPEETVLYSYFKSVNSSDSFEEKIQKEIENIFKKLN